MKAKRPHPMVGVKVNALVDKGIAPLVLALSKLPVWTLDSCQGKNGRPARVCFSYLGSRKKNPAFVACLTKIMAEKIQREWLYTITLSWHSGEESMCKIECNPKDILQVSKILQSVVNDDRMTAFFPERGL